MSTGLNSYVGFAEEVTWGTFVPAATFLPANSSGFTFAQDVLKSPAVVTGRFVQDDTQTAPGKETVEGKISYPLYRGDVLNLLLKHALGSQSGAGTTLSKYTWGPATLLGKGLSITVGKPDTTGVVRVVGYAGCKIKSWSIGVSAGQIATIDFDFVGKETAIRSAPTVVTSLPSVYAGVHAALTVGGGARVVESLTVSGDAKLDSEIYLGSNQIVEPLTVDNRAYMVEATVDFNGVTDLTTYLAAPAAQLVVATLTAGTDVLQLTANAILTGGADPDVAGKGRLTQSLKFECYEHLATLTGALLIQQWDSAT